MEDLRCAYEIAREEQIKKNKDFLKSLNLINPITKKEKIFSPSTNNSKNKRGNIDNSASTRKRQKKNIESVLRPKRRSSRLSNKDAVNYDEDKDVAAKIEKVEEANRLLKYEKLLKLHKKNGNAALPKTASYAHTLDRVLSMSMRALESRMRKIEKANGKYAIVKMRMFAEVLLLEGYTELATKCEESLLRLQTKK